MIQRIESDMNVLIEKLPPHIFKPLTDRKDLEGLLEIVLDLGREPVARFANGSFSLNSQEISPKDIQYVKQGIGTFGKDNRAGIERTLHRISAIRNRDGDVVGLTLRVGRAVYGTIKIIEDLLSTGKSVVLVGKPGVGKTTMLREVARVLADDAHKRVIVVDTSNEIAGDGDIPHPGIGQSRRMQVPTPELQHAVMIEAVENHMPEVIVIDEIGTERETNAARTIAERGVQLIATAHGNTLENLMMNPTLSDLVGGIESVTLGDDEARRRHTQKTVLERKSLPTFDILVEIRGWNHVAIHPDVAEVVDRLLRGTTIRSVIRTIDEKGNIHQLQGDTNINSLSQNGSNDGRFSPNHAVIPSRSSRTKTIKILPYGVNKGKILQALRGNSTQIELVADINKADLLLTTKNYFKRRTQALRMAEKEGKPIYVLRKNTTPQIDQFIKSITRSQKDYSSDALVNLAIQEAEKGISRIQQGESPVKLNPQGAYVRRIQHQIAEQYGLTSDSAGKEPRRQVVIYKIPAQQGTERSL